MQAIDECGDLTELVKLLAKKKWWDANRCIKRSIEQMDRLKRYKAKLAPKGYTQFMELII